MAAQDWSTGWRVFADRNDDGTQDVGEETLVERPLAAEGISFRPYFGSLYRGTVLPYDAEGRLHRPGGRGLVLGRLALTLDGVVRSLCFASLGMRTVAMGGSRRPARSSGSPNTPSPSSSRRAASAGSKATAA